MDKFTIKHDIKGFHVFLDITGDYMFTTDAKDKADSIVQALEKQIPQQVVRRDTGLETEKRCWDIEDMLGTLKRTQKGDYIMEFRDLFARFISGTPIKRKAWKGCWIYKYGKIEMHTKTGDIVDFLDTEDILFTISGILQDDWEIATSENCDILK